MQSRYPNHKFNEEDQPPFEKFQIASLSYEPIWGGGICVVKQKGNDNKYSINAQFQIKGDHL